MDWKAWCIGFCNQTTHDSRSLGIRAVFNPADKLDHISTAAVGKTMPDAACEVDAEGRRVIALVDWTGTIQVIVFSYKFSVKPISSKDLTDSDL